MRVHPSQLIPGCVLLRDVSGKVSRPIIPKKTVLTEEHITVLHKFLVEAVEVSEKLHDGKVFKPNPEEVSENQSQENIGKEVDVTSLSFKDHYFYVVKYYQTLFNAWRNNVPIDMVEVRNLILPLMDRMDNVRTRIHSLHHFTNKRDYFYHHSVSVSLLSGFLAKKMGYDKGEWIQIGLAGLLADAGMSRIHPFLLEKKGAFNQEERMEMIKHPTYSYRLLEKNPSVSLGIKLAVLQHHERIDGSGYPLGLSNGKIHDYAKVVAVCDIYHAMTSDRLYKEKQSPFRVIEELQKEQYTKLDLFVVQAFINSISNFTIGTKVRLSNDKKGEVVFMDPKHPTRPIVRIEENDAVIPLMEHKDIYIQEII
ncbi:HD-GYP domain, c-di-GMP phosphodiesterase class II (or its inactivated variant) [Oceanobacillus limi]|uniref:HD-GYP domain, c-di-GMP phosphodiesterase class II (Or its inactivated variant) n=1 Tax=Oceanobacillus limi TaxID=930131 RepID=A0A1I0GTX0_9BACI|nr:HD-GYP domain-containing protein [Oceanobacillus limi]SET74822.1 HD-GYP domain, c-di-GMP phosphodiesterase class II (or its inactivated variant) [Oceanobacillus limi]